jgi:hypothetical protein
MEGGEELAKGGTRCCSGCTLWRDVLSSKGSVDIGSMMAVVEGSSGGGSDVG